MLILLLHLNYEPEHTHCKLFEGFEIFIKFCLAFFFSFLDRLSIKVE